MTSGELEVDLVDFSAPSPPPTPIPSFSALEEIDFSKYGDWQPIKPSVSKSKIPSVPVTPSTPHQIPLPLTPPNHTPVLPSDAEIKLEITSDQPSRTVKKEERNSVPLNPSAPSFARQLRIRRSASPPSFYPGDSAKAINSPTTTETLANTVYGPPSPTSSTVYTHQISPIIDKGPVYPSSLAHSALEYGVEESWGNGGYLGGISFPPVVPVSSPVSGFNFDGKILVAERTLARLPARVESKPIRITSPPIRKPKSSGEGDAIATTAIGSDVGETIAPLSTSDISSVSQGDDSTVPDPLDHDTSPSYETAIDQLARSFSVVSFKDIEDERQDVFGPNTPRSVHDHEDPVYSQPSFQESIASPLAIGSSQMETILNLIGTRGNGFLEDLSHEIRILGDFDLKSTRPTDSLQSSLESTKRIEALESLVKGLKQQKEEAVARCSASEREKELVKIQWIALEADKNVWEKKEKVLAQRYLSLQEDYARLQDSGQGSFVAVILVGTADLFTKSLLRRKREGGNITARALMKRVGEVFSLINSGERSSRILMSLFLDVPKVERELVQSGYIDDGSIFRHFLDGFNETDPLISVVDVAGFDGSVMKAKAHLSHMVGLTACGMLVLGAVQGDQLLTLPKVQASDKTYAFKRPNALQSYLSQDRLIPTSVLFEGLNGDLTKLQPGKDSMLSPISSSSADTVRGGSPPVSPSLAAANEQPPWRTGSSLGNQVPSTVAPSTSQSTSLLQSSSANSNRGSLLDQYYANRIERTKSPSEVSILQSETSQIRSSTHPSSVANQTKNIGRPQIIIPFDPSIEGSIAGSPPSSDEDEPSVQLPHSAVRFVQRSIAYNDTADDDSASITSDTASTTSTQTASTVRRVPGFDNATRGRSSSLLDRMSTPAAARTTKTRGRSVTSTNANNTPLGGGKRVPWTERS